MTEVDEISLRAILDSRGNRTIEAEVTSGGVTGRAAAPSGASTGRHEAVELPADDAVGMQERVEDKLGGVEINDQRSIDAALHRLDGTDNFSELGANVAVAVSMAAAKAGAKIKGVPLYRYLGSGTKLPTPLGNIIGGGEHAESGPSIQEFLSIPSHLDSMQDRAFYNADMHKEVSLELSNRGISCGKGDEGAWAPDIDDDTALGLLRDASLDMDNGGSRLGLDVAASELYSDGGYSLEGDTRTRSEQIEYIEEVARKHDLLYIEDPLEEEDFEGFAELTERLNDTDTLICGDDLFVTNQERIQRGVEMDAGNAVLIKPNQIGTLTDTFNAIEIARDNGFTPVISHRSGETEDTTISHIAVGLDIPYIKTGAVGGERTAKLNELIRIQFQMKPN